MNHDTNRRRLLLGDDTATSSIEYALVGSLIAVVCVIVLALVGSNLSALYMEVCNQVSGAVSGGSPC